MTHASLFSGIGGFDLAAEWLGWDNIFNCEIDEFCTKVLNYHFPNATHYGDITSTDFTIHRGEIDVLTGGFPCQPFSLAGARRGTEDDRFLWPQMYRAICEISPRWIVAENVRGILTQQGGVVFERVWSDLENAGYECQAFLIPACSVGAPHRRERVWFVAHRADAGFEGMREWTEQVSSRLATSDTNLNGQRIGACKSFTIERSCRASNIGTDGAKEVVANAKCKGLERADKSQRQERGVWECVRRHSSGRDIQDFADFPTQSPVCSGDDGLSPRLDAITFPAWRRESIKAYGNAIVPQVFYQIGLTINEYENTHTT